MPRLKELTETNVSNDSIEGEWYHVFYDLCPETWNWIKGIKIKEYKEMWLVETEKLLRRLRLFSLKMDRFSGLLIQKIRKHVYTSKDLTFSTTNDNKSEPVVKTKEEEAADFKRAEQKLIIEIAKNPKSAVLYEELGDLYLEIKEYQDAKESYEAATELDPQNEELKKKLSSALEKLNSQN